MSKTPSVDDLFLAANWLDVYEDAEDKDACERVRKWLLKKAEEIELHKSCREAGIPVWKAKKAIMDAKKKVI